MIDSKNILHNNFLTGSWRWLKTKLYPYLGPWVNRYRAYRAKHPKKAKLLFFTGSVFGGGFALLLFFYLLMLIGLFGKMPSRSDLRNLNQNLASEVYSEDGVLLGKYFIENRLPADLKDVSPFITNALLATEDARFYDHSGVDLRATFRVLFKTILQGDESSGGGSTLTQQLAKNLYPRKKLGFLTVPVAKIKEMFIAWRLESVYSKNEILALYLNTVPFSDNVFGIRVVAKRFFDATPETIKAEEAAVLIGMLKATTAYNPARNPKRSQERRNTVLARMVKHGYLEQAAFDSLKLLPVVLKYSSESHDEGLATYFREHLRLDLDKELQKFTKPDGRPYNVYTDGLKIYTTINSKMQQYAEESVNEHMKDIQKSFDDHFKGYKDAVPWGSDELLQQQIQGSERYRRLKEAGLSAAEIDSNFVKPVKMTVFSWETETEDKDTTMTPLDSVKYYLTVLNTGFLAADPKTGKILAWVGGINFKHFKYDHVKSLRQVGSTFKPVVYAEALEQNIDPCERFPNDLIRYDDYEGWTPRNADGNYGGSYSMRGALRMSINTVAVQLIMRVGVDSVMNLAKRMGITAKIPREPGIALGSVDATVFEMVRLFSTFANRGVVPELFSLTRIETAEGKTLAQFNGPDPKSFPRVLQEQHADMVRYLLQSVVDGGTGGRLRYLTNFPWPAGGKTGTTNNNSDGWFIGFTPDIVTGAWVGAEQPVVRWRATRLGQGGVTALPICGKFLAKVYNDPAFKNLQKNNFPPLTGAAAGAFGCPDFIAPDSTLLDSLYNLEHMHPDSMPEEERIMLIQKIKDLLKAGGYEEIVEDPVEEEENGSIIDEVKGIFKKKDKSGKDTEKGSGQDDGLSEESERVRKKNEKLERKRERQKNRKETIDNLLKKGN